MSKHKQSTLTQQLQKLDELYHITPLDVYEAALHSAIQQLKQTLPDFTIAYAEIFNAGSERAAHGGMRHVLLPRAAHQERSSSEQFEAREQPRRFTACG
jgi:hypothetical protein